MNQGIKLLLLRMDSHPAEFEMEFGPIPQDSNAPRILPEHQQRWRWAIRLLVDAQPPEGLEVQLVREKYWALQETAFSKRVMACLIDGSDSPYDSS